MADWTLFFFIAHAWCEARGKENMRDRIPENKIGPDTFFVTLICQITPFLTLRLARLGPMVRKRNSWLSGLRTYSDMLSAFSSSRDQPFYLPWTLHYNSHTTPFRGSSPPSASSPFLSRESSEAAPFQRCHSVDGVWFHFPLCKTRLAHSSAGVSRGSRGQVR